MAQNQGGKEYGDEIIGVESYPLLYRTETKENVIVPPKQSNAVNHQNDLHYRSSAAPLGVAASLSDDGKDTFHIMDEGMTFKESNGQKKHSFQISALAGNVVEWYDFAVFGYFSDVIGQVFFPPQRGNAAIIESLCVFGGAFVMRPLGGLLMGYIGDSFGHKLALEVSIWIMALPTLLLGCLPSYERVGWWAPAGLIFVRLLQGLSVGGQLMSSVVFLADNCPDPQKELGYHCSFVSVSTQIGVLLGGLTAFALHHFLSWEQLESWGWRLPFLCGGLFITISGLTLNHESGTGDNNHHHPNQNPLRGAFSKKNLPSLICSIGVVLLGGSSFYLVYVWLAIYMKNLIDPPVPYGFLVNSFSMVFGGAFFPISGHLSDVYGRRRIMFIGGIALSLQGPFWLRVISTSTKSFASRPLLVTLIGLLAQSSLGISVSLWVAPMMAWLVENFDPSIRLTSVSVGYNTAMCIAGGFGPALATVLLDRYGPIFPGFIFSMVAPISLMALYLSPTKTYPVKSRQSIGDNLHMRKQDLVHYDSCVTDDGESFDV